MHRIGTFHIVQKLQSDQGSTSSSTPQPRSQGEETLEHCAAPLHSPPPPPLLGGCAQQGRALKLSAVGFTSSDRFLKQQHKVLVWLSGNLKLWRQSCPPPPAKNASAPGPGPGAVRDHRAAHWSRERAFFGRWRHPLGATLGEETGKENPTVTVQGEGGRQSRRCKKGWGWGENGRNLYSPRSPRGLGGRSWGVRGPEV